MEGVPEPVAFGFTVCAGNAPEDLRDWMHMSEMRSGGWDPKERCNELDQDSVDAEILFPNRPWQSVVANQDPELHHVMVRAYNDWLSEYAEYDLDVFRALPILPNRGQDMALAEVERVGGRKSTGGFCMGAFPNGSVVPKPEDDPVFAALAERKLPVNIHVSLTSGMPGSAV